jgi:putative membrane protein
VAPHTSWSFDPTVLLGVFVLVLLYAAGWHRARRPGERHRPPVWRALLFAAGILTILIALVSPLDSLGDQIMFMHMVQHMLLLDLAPILLILGLTKVLLRPVTRRIQTIERRAGFFGHPAFAVIFYAASLWLWHLPALYDKAEGNGAIHAFEHLTFFAAGSLYWWHVLSPIRSRARLTGLGQVGYMAAGKLLVGLLGIALAFAPRVLYPYFAHQPHYWGLTPLESQMIAGLVMALEQSIVMGIALVWLFMQMLNESERTEQRAERFEVVS